MTVIKCQIIKCKICGKVCDDVEDPDEPHVCNDCFRCPNCGASPTGPAKDKATKAKIENRTWNADGYFVIDEGEVGCSVCERGWTFRAFEKALMKKVNRQTCPTCKGCGTVPK